MTVVVFIAALGIFPLSAAADPVPPPAPPPPPPGTDPIAATVAQVHELSRQAEVLTEQWHLAKDRLQASRAAADRARGDLAKATAAADRARKAQESFRGQVDRLTRATFQGVRVNSMTALLISDSPQEFLDQAFALDVLAVSSKEAMARLAAAVARAEQAELAATDAETRTAVAELDAGRITNDVVKARQQMSEQIGLVQARLGQLTVDEFSRYASEGFIDFPIDVQGEGVGAAALRAALSRQGAPYIWGAEGPNTFDCSGLVAWAYRQAGVILPRSSWQQARVGKPVVSGLKQGDLIALYQPVSHIGIYVGEGLYVNAPQAGDVVKVARVPWHVVTAVRRIG
ncbi:MAG TPA: C40 family peptidase [Pseudonocardiaceae bacterium]|nr:C40 family peptidase [Pseudonocardiaceae bacterium]